MFAIEMEGKVFRSQEGDEYGVIRAFQGSRPEGLQGEVLAEDGCGNFFVVLRSGGVAFWDHETNAATLLAESLAAFSAGLSEPEPVVLQPGQVQSVWVDPEFAKTFGLREGQS